jgi:hypothetical protein
MAIYKSYIGLFLYKRKTKLWNGKLNLVFRCQFKGIYKDIIAILILLYYFCKVWGVTLAQLVKLLSCDWKVTGSSPGNSLLCKKRVRLHTIHQMVGPLLGPCVCGSFSAPGCPFYYFCKVSIMSQDYYSVSVSPDFD